MRLVIEDRVTNVSVRDRRVYTVEIADFRTATDRILASMATAAGQLAVSTANGEWTVLDAPTANNQIIAADLIQAAKMKWINSTLGYGNIWLSAAGGWPSTTSGCAANTKSEQSTNKQNAYTLDFDKDTQEYAEWGFRMPDDWDGGTLLAQFYWMANATSGDCIWGVQGRSYGNAETLDQAFGTAVTVTDGASATAYQVLISAESGVITFAGTPAAGEYVQVRVYRKAADGSDTLAVDAKLIGVLLKYAKA